MYTNTIDHLEFRKFIKKSFVNGTQPAYHSNGFACPPLQAQLRVQLSMGGSAAFQSQGCRRSRSNESAILASNSAW